MEKLIKNTPPLFHTRTQLLRLTRGTRSWTYDAVGNRTFVSENVNSTTATNTLVYDGDDELLKDTVVNNSFTSSNYLINSSVLGKLLVKLDASGGKDTTYVPVNDYVAPLEQKDFQGNPTIGWVTRDASGLQENDRAADPFGNLINNVQPPVVGAPPNIPFYGPGYMNPSNAAFTNANNYAMSCVLDGITAPCTEVMNAVNHGNATQCPDNYCGPRFFTLNGQPGVFVSNGAGYWASDGKSSENLFLGDVQYGSLLDGLIAHFRNPQTKSTKKGSRVSPQPKPDLPAGEGPQNPGSQIVPLGNLQKGLEGLLKGDCGVFVQKLIDKANELFGGGRPHATSFWDAFSRIQDAGGYQFDDEASNGATVSGELFLGELVNPSLPEGPQAGPGTVHMRAFGTIGRSASPSEVAIAQARYVYKALHETLHLAKRGWYYDEDLARAGHAVDGTPAPKYGKDHILNWSEEFDRVLQRHCAYPFK